MSTNIVQPKSLLITARKTFNYTHILDIKIQAVLCSFESWFMYAAD